MQLDRIAELAELSEEKVEAILQSILKQHDDIGTYYDLEQVFVRKSPEDKLLEDAFTDWQENVKKGYKGT